MCVLQRGWLDGKGLVCITLFGVFQTSIILEVERFFPRAFIYIAFDDPGPLTGFGRLKS